MKTRKLLLVLLCALMCISCLASCKKEEKKPERKASYLTVLSGDKMNYTIVRPDNASDEEEEAGVTLRKAFREKFKVNPELVTDWIKRGETLEEGLLEILVGDTNREESQIVKNSLDGDMYGIVVLNNKIVIAASDDEYIDDAVDAFINTYIKPAESKVEIEATTNSIAIKTASGWLEARTLEIQIVATHAEKNGVEIIAAVNDDDFTEMGFEIDIDGSKGLEEKTLKKLADKGKSYKKGESEYKAADYGKTTIVSATLKDISAEGLTKISITPYVVEFGNTLYGLDAFACSYDGVCETLSTVELAEQVYQITNPAELFVFADYVNKGHRVADAALSCDLDLGNAVWQPIASDDMSYKGTFSGKGHTVKNFYINSEGLDCAGFFGCTGSGSAVKELNIENAYLFANNNKKAGIIAGESRGLIENCNVKASTVSTTSLDKKTAFTYPKNGTMQGIGGLVGVLNGRYLTSIEGSTFSGNIDISGKNVTFVGGIAGKSLAISGDIKNCINLAEINVSSDFTASTSKDNTGYGGIVGSVVNGMVSGCENKGTVKTSGKTVGYVGGICGNVIGMGQIIDCSNSGALTASFASDKMIQGYVGGIVGVFSGNMIADGMVLRCYNNGEINAGKGYAGGVAGLIADCRSYIMYSYNNGKITAESYAGGILASASFNRCFVMNCYNSGDVSAKNASGIIGYTSAQFNETYKIEHAKDDIYANYVNNCYLSTKTANAYQGSKKSSEGGYASEAELSAAVMAKSLEKSNMISAYEYYVEKNGANSALPGFAYQKDSTKVDPSVDKNLYLIHATNNVPDGSMKYYLVNRYTDYMEDHGQKMTVAEFEAKLGQTVENPHNLLDIDGNTTGTCNCACFEKDHYFSIERWVEILDDVENNFFGVADWANRGEIRHIGYLKADDEQGEGSVAVTWRTVGDHRTLSICFNVRYYKNGRNDGATVHEMAHAQLLDSANESWFVEGNADYVKFNYYEGTDLKNYKWKADDYQVAYAPTASCFSFLSYQYGFETQRIIYDFATANGKDGGAGWKLAFGATYQEIWDLFGEAGKYNKTAYFED